MAAVTAIAVVFVMVLWLRARRSTKKLRRDVADLTKRVAERELWLRTEVNRRKAMQRKNAALQAKNRRHHETVAFLRAAFDAVKIRQHVNSDYTPKRRYRTMVDAKAIARKLEEKDSVAMDAYQCELCRGWHVGHRAT